MDNLLELAHMLGPYAICGEGNVSMKDGDCFWVKASGTSLDTLKKVDLVACNNYKNGSDAAKLIQFPSMFIFGSLDKMVNLEAGKKFSSLINNSSTHIIEGCGHMIMIEKAFEMRDKVLEFLKK